jgi:hypothetical protein
MQLGQRQRSGLTLHYWDRMMISSVGTLPTEYRFASSGAAEALALLATGMVAAGSDQAGGGWTVPSAGAIHPYEYYVLAVEGSALAAFHVDPARRTCTRTPVADPAGPLLAAAGVEPPGDGEALVVIVTRPWLSMRKYGDRGYLYVQLDTAHLAANLVGIAADLGAQPELRLRFRRQPLADLLLMSEQCREIHSVLTITRTGRAGAPPGWAVHEMSTGPERPSELEQTCWQSLGPLVTDEALPQLPVQRAPLLRAVPDLPLDGRIELAGRWRELSRDRRSSKRFRASAVPGGALGHALSAARTRLPVDLPHESALRCTLVVRSVTGLTPGVYRTGAGRPGGEPSPPGDDDVVQACMYQEHLRHAAALVLFHVPRRHLVNHPATAVREILFRAGAVGHLLYLGATGSGVGITGVGGFDARRWRQLAGLPYDHELLYLVLFGHDGGAGVKWDRLPTAYAQNER